MTTTSRTRPSSVQAALFLQTLLTAITVFSCVRILATWSGYAAIHAQVFGREIVPGAILAVSLIGLWNSKSWGWILAMVADCTLCAEVLWLILNYPGLTRSPRFVVFNIMEFAAVAALTFGSVREHFFRRPPRTAPRFPAEDKAGASQTVKRARTVIYFALAALVSCSVTAFSLAVFMAPRTGGSSGFLLFLVFGVTTGGLASLLFVSMLTTIVRMFGPTRLWVWLLFGASLAPLLVVTLGTLGRYFVVGVLYFVFWGPATLVQVWWLTLPTGVVTGWICYLMYPWAYQVGADTQALGFPR